MKKCILLTGLLLLSLIAMSQNKVTVTGTIVDVKTEEAVAKASVRILNQSDSAYVAGGVTNNSGVFSISVNPGKYILQMSFLGYSDISQNVDAVRQTNDLGTIKMSENTILLQEALVVGKAVEVIVREDTVEYNADSYKVLPSAMVEDLLKKMPGAEVSEDGTITVNGREIKKILVDGKEFFSDDPKVASKNLPASMVNKVQVYDRRSDMAQMTGFDDGEDVAVINLTVKPGMKQGVFGNAYAGYGTDDRFEANAMVNYMQNNSQFSFLGGANNTNNAGFSDFASSMFSGNRPRGGMSFGGNNGITTAANGGFNFATELNSKFKFGGDIRYGRSDNDVQQDNYTKYISTNEDSIQIENRKNVGNNISDNFGVNFRMEWTPDSATTVIFKPNFQYNKNENHQSDSFATTWNNLNDSINKGSSAYNSYGDGINLSGELEVSRKLNNKGRVLSFSLSGGIGQQSSNGDNRSDIYYYEQNDTVTVDQIFDQKDKSHNWRGYVSFVEPLGRNNFLQLNYSFRKNYSETDKDTYSRDPLTNLYDSIDVSATRFVENDFINQEIGANFKMVREKYNLTAGVALQPSSTKTWETVARSQQPDTTYLTSNNVLNFAPVAQFNYMWSRQKNLRINYNGSVNQPSNKQLSSAVDMSDPTNIVMGNPLLKPSFSNRFRLRFRDFNSERASAFMLMGNFNFTTNDIVSRTTRSSNGNRQITYENINGNWNADIRATYNTPFKPSSKFSVNSMTYVRYAESNGYINEDKNKLGSLNLSERAGLSYRSDQFDFGINGNFSLNSANNSLSTTEDTRFYNYGASANATVYLPWDLTIDSDINYSTNSGYSDGFKQEELLWNAGLTKQLFKNKSGSLKIKVYDILQQRSNISQSTTTERLQQSITNTLDSYFMLYFTYKFQLFKGGAKASDMEQRGPGGRGGFGGGRPPM